MAPYSPDAGSPRGIEEIEAAILSMDGMRQSIVIVRVGISEERCLVGYYVADEIVDPRALYAHLQRVLPEYMIPSALIALDCLPMLPGGDVDRAALPFEPERDMLIRNFVQPATQTERMVAVIWRELLQVSQVGRGDNFFELGGHSLLAGRVIEQVKQQFRIPLTMSSLYECPDLRQFCAHVDEVKASGRKIDR